VANTIITCGIFLYSRKTEKFLVCHATNSRWTQWSIPKGILEKGEEQFAAAARELSEETGIDIQGFANPNVFELPPRKYEKQNKELRSFLVIVDSVSEQHVYKSTLVPGKNFPEVDSWKWISLAEAPKWIHEAQAKVLEAIRVLIQ
jgi:8-oxo-dGTP pyrophosphatase MutT (NUDIX family)